MKRITCVDLELGVTCDDVFEAETDTDLLEQALAHARDSHEDVELDEARLRDRLAQV